MIPNTLDLKLSRLLVIICALENAQGQIDPLTRSIEHDETCRAKADSLRSSILYALNCCGDLRAAIRNLDYDESRGSIPRIFNMLTDAERRKFSKMRDK